MFSSGKQIKLVATNQNTDETRRFVLKSSGAVGSDGLKLFGYNPDKNKLNLLEDFGIEERKTKPNVTKEAKQRLHFYCPKDKGWTIKAHEPPLSS